jgi:hypothetical protein
MEALQAQEHQELDLQMLLALLLLLVQIVEQVAGWQTLVALVALQDLLHYQELDYSQV